MSVKPLKERLDGKLYSEERALVRTVLVEYAVEKGLTAKGLGGGNAKLAKTLIPRLALASDVFQGLERNRQWTSSKAHDALIEVLHNQCKSDQQPTL